MAKTLLEKGALTGFDDIFASTIGDANAIGFADYDSDADHNGNINHNSNANKKATEPPTANAYSKFPSQTYTRRSSTLSM